MTLCVFSVLYNKLCHVLFDLFWVVIFLQESFTYLFLSIHMYFHLFWVVWAVICNKQAHVISFPDNASVQLEQMDERLVGMYKSIKQILSKYRSGKLPKAFKVIPAVQNWEQVNFIQQ